MMFPFVDNEEDNEKEENLYIPREYGINFETGQLSGKIVEGYDALLVWVWLALKTPRYRYYIYSEDSAGGVIECRITGTPAGLGEPVFDKLSALLAHALMSIGAVKAVEIGDGIAVTSSNGSTDNDGFTVKDGEIIKTSNHAGGIMGGISDGSEIILRAHIKPTPSISQPQQTVTKDKEPLSLEIHGRHDPVIVPRAVVVVESMAAITLADALFVNMSSQMDKVRDFYRK